MALGMWWVPLTTVLEAEGMHAIRPYAFATSALAALVSPLVFGALADRHLGPVRVLRWIALDYVLRIGLSGRAGATGEAFSLVCFDETDLLRGVQRLLLQAIPWTVEEGFFPDRDSEPRRCRSTRWRASWTGPCPGHPRRTARHRCGRSRRSGR